MIWVLAATLGNDKTHNLLVVHEDGHEVVCVLNALAQRILHLFHLLDEGLGALIVGVLEEGGIQDRVIERLRGCAGRVELGVLHASQQHLLE